MPSLDYCLENADAMAAEVVNAWALSFRNTGPEDMPADFKSLLDLACVYQDIRRENDLHLKSFNRLDERDAAKEDTARQTFCKAVVAYQDKHPKAGRTGETRT